MYELNRHTYYNRYKRDQGAKRFYNSKAWEKARSLALIRDHYLCQECLKSKIIRVYDVVHHIKPYKDYPKLALVLNNLISLCHACHNKIESESRKGKKRCGVVEFKANEELG